MPGEVHGKREIEVGKSAWPTAWKIMLQTVWETNVGKSALQTVWEIDVGKSAWQTKIAVSRTQCYKPQVEKTTTVQASVSAWQTVWEIDVGNAGFSWAGQ